MLPSDGQLGPAHTQGAISELMTLTYRLHTQCQGFGVELVGGVRSARVAAHAMQLLLAVQLDMDTEQRYIHVYMDMYIYFVAAY